MIVIGDEILSGRTEDKNINFVANYLTNVGIELSEVRIVPDKEDDIVRAVRELIHYTYVFTTGGIGPTHDDITAEAISKAFGLPCEHDKKAIKMLGEHYKKAGLPFTEARKRMARMPKGAKHIKNTVSMAPGFSIQNVHVMAGIPKVMQAMMDQLVPKLKKGKPILSEYVDCPLAEGTVAQKLAKIQKEFLGVSIGSYPKFHKGKITTQIVVRAKQKTIIKKAIREIKKMIKDTKK